MILLYSKLFFQKMLHSKTGCLLLTQNLIHTVSCVLFPYVTIKPHHVLLSLCSMLGFLFFYFLWTWSIAWWYFYSVLFHTCHWQWCCCLVRVVFYHICGTCCLFEEQKAPLLASVWQSYIGIVNVPPLWSDPVHNKGFSENLVSHMDSLSRRAKAAAFWKIFSLCFWLSWGFQHGLKFGLHPQDNEAASAFTALRFLCRLRGGAGQLLDSWGNGERFVSL